MLINCTQKKTILMLCSTRVDFQVTLKEYLLQYVLSILQYFLSHEGTH